MQTYLVTLCIFVAVAVLAGWLVPSYIRAGCKEPPNKEKHVWKQLDPKAAEALKTAEAAALRVKPADGGAAAPTSATTTAAELL